MSRAFNTFPHFLAAFLLLMGMSVPAAAQLQVTQGGNPTDLVNNVLLGSGVTAMNVTFTGDATLAIGTFTTGASPTNLGLVSGLIMASGDVLTAIGPNTASGAGSGLGEPGDSLLTAWGGQNTFDAAVLEFDFIPQGDTISFRYVFGSEEYPEYVINLYNDIFGFFISDGPDPITYLPMEDKNIALVPGTNLAVNIANINNVIPSYPQYYVDNGGGLTIEYDGFTTVLTAWCQVVPCMIYHMKLAIADGGDPILDSGVFLEAGSFSSGGIQTVISYSNPDLSLTAIEGCNDAIVTFKLPNPTPDGYVIPYSILASSTAIYGVDYDSIPSPLLIPPGSDSASIVVHAFVDGLAEGPETVGLVVPTTICLTDYDTIFFTILDYFEPVFQTLFPDTLILCGEQVTLTAQVSGGLEPYTYQWSEGTANDSVTVGPTITTMYYLTVTDFCGSSLYDSVLVTIYGPVADAGPDTTICTGGTAVLTANGGDSYQWSNGMTGPVISVSPLVTTSYTVTVTQVCSDVDTVTVWVNPLPLVTAGATHDSVCPGESTLLLGGGASTYSWTAFPADASLAGQENQPTPMVSPVSNTLYTVTGTDTNQCVNTATQLITVKPVPVAGFTVSSNQPCIHYPVTVTFSGIAAPDATFLWNFGGGTANGSGIGPYDVVYDVAGDHEISLQVDWDGCLSNTFHRTITVIPRPTAMFDADITSGCVPLSVHFDEYSTDVIPGSVFEWYFGNGQQTLLRDPDYTYLNPGTYTVTLVVTNQYGCNDTLKKDALIHVYPEPDAAMEIFPRNVTVFDALVKFYDRSWGTIGTWEWDFGDGFSANQPSVSHSYADTGTFQVILTVITDHGCVDSAYGEVKVIPDNTIYFPNAFSPNHDDHNDIFRAFGTNISEFRMEIFDRWGERLFTSGQLEEGWDGSYQGEIVPGGVYVVIVKYRDIQGNRRSHYGKVTVIR